MILLESFYRLVNKYNQKTKIARQYGTEHLLYPAEVHLIEIIGNHETITTTALAQTLGITKGAVSQTTAKLEGKGLIEKRGSQEKRTEVHIRLTEAGQAVFAFHRQLHAEMMAQVDGVLKELPPESQEAVNRIVAILEQSLDKL